MDYFVPDTSIMITVQNTIDVVNDMMDWIKGANKTDLLRKPFINVINERWVQKNQKFFIILLNS